jgi:hypothetical protein
MPSARGDVLLVCGRGFRARPCAHRAAPVCARRHLLHRWHNLARPAERRLAQRTAPQKFRGFRAVARALLQHLPMHFHSLNWSYAGLACLLLCCSAQTQSAGDEPETPTDVRNEPEAPTLVPQVWEGALSVQHIEGEGFHQIWGTDDRLWALGEPKAPQGASGSGLPLQPCPSRNRLPADNILRRSGPTGWEAMPLPESPALSSLHGSSDSNVWMVGMDGAALSFDGASWRVHDVRSADGLEFEEATEPCAELSLRSVFARSPDDVWAVGHIFPSRLGPGLVLHYDGQAWRRDAIDTLDGLFDVWASSPTDAWAVGASGSIFHYDGDTWHPFDGKTSDYLFSVVGTGAGDVWAAGNTAATSHFDGTAWTLVEPSKPGAERKALAASANAGLWALDTTRYSPSGIFRQALVSWDSAAWIEHGATTRSDEYLYDLWLTPEGQLWGVGGAIMRLR